ncbi:hypothetical protein [Aquabacterium sp.]|uniref:hypothetical protein n=1 Tax=Aquabacterium sp. TaxID=1872578 RepID=UPI0019C0F8AF|nr:hypothetical protein [Aquabacterium sp.]MBC7701543.1 hypothetical protein [Aquabacterium sp.]
MKKIAFSFLLTLNLLSAHAGENLKFRDAGEVLVSQIEKALIRKSLCSSPSNCVNKEMVLFRSTDDGLEISLYNTVDRGIASEIMSACAVSLVDNKMKEISLEFFAKSKKEQLKSKRFFGDTPELSYLIKGKYAESNN